MSDHLYRRSAEALLLEALARMVGEARGYVYFTFDDEVARAASETDPLGFTGTRLKGRSSTRCSACRGSSPL
jgi:hypothetical protein